MNSLYSNITSLPPSHSIPKNISVEGVSSTPSQDGDIQIIAQTILTKNFGSVTNYYWYQQKELFPADFIQLLADQQRHGTIENNEEIILPLSLEMLSEEDQSFFNALISEAVENNLAESVLIEDQKANSTEINKEIENALIPDNLDLSDFLEVQPEVEKSDVQNLPEALNNVQLSTEQTILAPTLNNQGKNEVIEDALLPDDLDLSDILEVQTEVEKSDVQNLPETLNNVQLSTEQTTLAPTSINQGKKEVVKNALLTVKVQKPASQSLSQILDKVQANIVKAEKELIEDQEFDLGPFKLMNIKKENNAKDNNLATYGTDKTGLSEDFSDKRLNINIKKMATSHASKRMTAFAMDVLFFQAQAKHLGYGVAAPKHVFEVPKYVRGEYLAVEYNTKASDPKKRLPEGFERVHISTFSKLPIQQKIYVENLKQKPLFRIKGASVTYENKAYSLDGVHSACDIAPSVLNRIDDCCEARMRTFGVELFNQICNGKISAIDAAISFAKEYEYQLQIWKKPMESSYSKQGPYSDKKSEELFKTLKNHNQEAVLSSFNGMIDGVHNFVSKLQQAKQNLPTKTH